MTKNDDEENNTSELLADVSVKEGRFSIDTSHFFCPQCKSDKKHFRYFFSQKEPVQQNYFERFINSHYEHIEVCT